MRILALVTARGGSKRVPKKNMRELGGKPLILWSIDSARDIPEICDILVSTDSSDIASACLDAGAMVPWIRPAELATDTAGSVEVALHALDWYEAKMGKVDGLLLLQPTSPFRTKDTINNGIRKFKQHAGLTVLGVSPTHSHPMWTLKEDGEYLVPYTQENGFGMRSQDLPPALMVNGSFYLITPENLRVHRSFVTTQNVPLLVSSPQESLDIDTEWDFQIAQYIVECKKNV
ncbi:MAG: acylneuraminate cytidylyltransferase family protein [Gallionellaceae bacterium]